MMYDIILPMCYIILWPWLWHVWPTCDSCDVTLLLFTKFKKEKNKDKNKNKNKRNLNNRREIEKKQVHCP